MGRSRVQGLVRAARWAVADTAAGRRRGSWVRTAGAGPPGHRHRAPESNHGPMMRDASAVGSSMRAVRGQWRKWRIPVISIVPSAASTTAMASASRIEPPGWTKAARRRRGRPRPRRGTGRRRPRRTRRPTVDAGAEHRVGLGDGLAGGVDARGLAAAHPDEPAVADEDDRVRRHAADEAPGEVEVELLVVGRRASGGARPGRRVVGDDVRRGHEDRAAGRPDRARVGVRPPTAGRRRRTRARSSTSTRRFGFVARISSASAREGGRDDDLEEDRGERLGRSRRSTSRVSATTPPKALTGSASSAAAQASSERRRARRRRTGWCA